MTKMRWDKGGERQIDPGAIVSPPDDARPDRWVPPLEQARKKAQRAEENKKLRERSERNRLIAMIKKYGEAEALRLGVPQAFIDERKALRARDLARQEKNKEKRLQREQAK